MAAEALTRHYKRAKSPQTVCSVPVRAGSFDGVAKLRIAGETGPYIFKYHLYLNENGRDGRGPGRTETGTMKLRDCWRRGRRSGRAARCAGWTSRRRSCCWSGDPTSPMQLRTALTTSAASSRARPPLVMTPEKFRGPGFNVDVRTEHDVQAIDRQAKTSRSDRAAVKLLSSPTSTRAGPPLVAGDDSAPRFGRSPADASLGRFPDWTRSLRG